MALSGINKMSLYSDEKKQEHISLVRKVMILDIDITGTRVQQVLKDKGYNLGLDYVYRLMKCVVGERRKRYDRETKNEIVAKFEDFVKDLEPKLRKISNESKSDIAKIEAIKSLISHYKDIINMQMDLGVLERNLGTIRSENYHFDIVKIAKLIEQAKQMKQDAGRKYHSIGNGE